MILRLLVLIFAVVVNTFTVKQAALTQRHRLLSSSSLYAQPPAPTVANNLEQLLSLGSPSARPFTSYDYTSTKGVTVTCQVERIANDVAQEEVDYLVDQLDDHKGVLLSSSYEVPGRYKRWTVGFVGPAMQIEGTGKDFTITPLNERGDVLCKILLRHLEQMSDAFTLDTTLESFSKTSLTAFSGRVIPSEEYVPEEQRSKQPSLFSLVGTIRDVFYGQEAGQLGLYGALGYDLTFQFEAVPPMKERKEDQRDLVMYLPDEILVVDNQKDNAWKVRYEFVDKAYPKERTVGLDRMKSISRYEQAATDTVYEERDSEKGAYAKSVIKAKEQFKIGNLFEVVLSQIFRRKVAPGVKPSTIFRRLSRRNPSPYGFFINLGNNEFLVGASPEMFVRVENTQKGLRVETCPISGTIERGSNPLEDAKQIMKLLSNPKEESELTMCTDVDRNDKSRICVPGSVNVLGRRQIELYSRLIHTVDHVEGYLRPGFDALDAFLCHTWAVTVTGAPKLWAIRFIEEMEPSVRHWYGGAVGMVGFDGTLNTGLTLRTVRVKDGIAEVRAGATLLHDSEPAAEEAETELKSAAMLDAIVRADAEGGTSVSPASAVDGSENTGVGKKVLLVDHEDSFVHTLANYIGQTGATVVTCRSGASLEKYIESHVDTGLFKPDLVVLSPGPGNPTDFNLSNTIQAMIDRRIPMFGVCLGLQGIVEHFQGSLSVLDYPMHGKPSEISRVFTDEDKPLEYDILRGLPQDFTVARYHSLYGGKDSFPSDLVATSVSSDGIIMALQHSTMPIAAVQFHPESILTSPLHGMRILTNALIHLSSARYGS